MNTTRTRVRLATMIMSGVLAGLVLAGCNRTAQPAAATPAPADALPLTDASIPLTPAPAAGALPPAPPVHVAHLRDQSQRYAYLDRATAMGQAFGSAPPDYTYDYQGERPWVWRSSDDARQVVEPLADGVRTYYYQPSASQPFLVRDGGYSYGYDNGQLVIVYDSYGRPLPPAEIGVRLDLAARYLQRAREIYQASLNARREAVARANWLARRDAYAREQARWEKQQAQDAEWRAYHDQYANEEAHRWAAERQMRQAEAERFSQATPNRPQPVAGQGNGQPPVYYAPAPLSSPTQGQAQQRQLQQMLAAQQAQAVAQAKAQAMRAQQQAVASEQARQRQEAEQSAAQTRAQAQVQAEARAQAAAQAQAMRAQQQAIASEQARQRLAAAQAAAQAREQSQAQAQIRAQAAAQAQAVRAQQQARVQAEARVRAAEKARTGATAGNIAVAPHSH